MATLQGVEIFAPGHWFPMGGPKKGVKIDMKFIRALLDNTVKSGVEAILKVGHSTKQILKGQTDGDPALGTARNFRLKGQKIIADFVDMPPILFNAIKKKLFRNVSVEIRPKNGKPIIEKISILGADLPAVESLKDLQKFFSQGTPDESICFAVSSWNETENQIRASMRGADDFQETTFRTKDLDGEKGIQVVEGRLNPDKVPDGNDPQSAVLQAYHFNKDSWSMEQAKEWLAERDLSENSEFSLSFSAPFMDESFFQETSIKDEEMTEEKIKYMGVDPEKHAEVLTKLNTVQAQLDQVKSDNQELMQFKQKIEDSDEVKLQAELDEAKSEIETLKAEKLEFSKSETEKEKELEELRTKVKASEEKEQEIQFSIKKADALEVYKQDVKEGKLAPAMLKKIESCFDEQKLNFSADAELTIPAKLNQEINKAYADGMPYGEQGNDDADEDGGMQFANASEELEHEAFKLQAKNADLDYKEASEMALRLNPQLGQKYKAWLEKEYAA